MTLTQERALAEARAWIGTPYRHQASTKGEGADCLGLIRGIWRTLYGFEPENLPAYTPDWAERGSGETLLEASRRWLIERDRQSAQPGDILLFRFSPDAVAKHCAIVCSRDRMIHAWQGRAVCETAIGPWWQRRLCAAFCFPQTQ